MSTPTPAPTAAPIEPSNVTGVPGNGTAIISWTAPPQPPPVQTYQVVGTTDFGGTPPDGFDELVAVSVDGTTTSALLSGLANGYPYNVYVTAVSSDGSAASDAITVVPAIDGPEQTDPNAPPLPPDPAQQPPPPVYPPEVDPTAVPFPVYGPIQAPADVTGRPVVPPTKVGHVQALYFEKLDNGQMLYLLPSRGGIWLTDLDLSAPTVQSITTPWPDRDGELDYTDRYGARTIVMNLLAEPWRGLDANGVRWPAPAWAELVRAWSSLDNRLRLHFQLTGRQPQYCDVRTGQYAAPMAMADLGRYTIPITWGLYAADGLVYGDPLPGYATDPVRPGWYRIRVTPNQSGGTALNFGGGTSFAGGPGGLGFYGGDTWAGGSGLTFGAGSSYGGPLVSVPQQTIGSRKTQPVITITGGAVTAPQVSVFGAGGLRSTLAFTSGLVLTAADTMLIDVPNRRVVRNPDAYGNGELLYKYLAGVVDWANFFIDPNDSNSFAFGGTPAATTAVAAFSYRSTFA